MQKSQLRIEVNAIFSASIMSVIWPGFIDRSELLQKSVHLVVENCLSAIAGGRVILLQHPAHVIAQAKQTLKQSDCIISRIK